MNEIGVHSVDKPSARRQYGLASFCRFRSPSGGIGRRASFRSLFSQGSGGSSPLLGTTQTKGVRLWRPWPAASVDLCRLQLPSATRQKTVKRCLHVSSGQSLTGPASNEWLAVVDGAILGTFAANRSEIFLHHAIGSRRVREQATAMRLAQGVRGNPGRARKRLGNQAVASRGTARRVSRDFQ